MGKGVEQLQIADYYQLHRSRNVCKERICGTNCHFQSVEEIRREAYHLRNQLQKELIFEEERLSEHTLTLHECERLEKALQHKIESCQRLIESEKNALLKMEPLSLRAEDIDKPVSQVYGQCGDVVHFFMGAQEQAESNLNKMLKEATSVSSYKVL
jgi:hypothetical protein